MLVLAVTLHNIPEGMAVGVVLAGMLSGGSVITAAGAFALAVGIAIQNFPEGAIISMPSLTQSVRFLTTAIASEMSYAAYGSLQRQALFSIGLVLFLFIMLLNAFLNLVIKRGGKQS